MFVFPPILATVTPISSVSAATGPRVMENLGRGVVAVRSGSNVFISWRLLALDPTGTGFNIYRSTAGGTGVKLNTSVLSAGTNYTDTAADLTKSNADYVKPVISSTEQAASAAYTLVANTASEPAFIVPIQSGGEIGNVWVGDFDGDHEYDFLVSRNRTTTQSLEAYKRDGTFLWSVNLGTNSTNQDNISPGSTAIDVGWGNGL